MLCCLVYLIIITVHAETRELRVLPGDFGSDCWDESDCCSLAASVGNLGVVFMEYECR